MIPKIIHYCWFGGNPLPPEILAMKETWQNNNPDYLIKEWNESNFDYSSYQYAKEAYKVKKYAFVSDVARLYALYTEGGIYLDTDVRVLKSFDPFLSYHSFIGKEAPFMLSTACIGAEKGTKWVHELLTKYKNIGFILGDGNIDKTPNTVRISGYLNNSYPKWTEELEVFDIDYFSAKLYPSMDIVTTPNTVCIHEFAGSWTSEISSFQKLKNKLIKRGWL